MPFTYDYPRPAVTVDAVVLRPSSAGSSEVLLIQRLHAPFQGQWALPGGFVDADEDPDLAVLRELEEETKITNLTLTQFGIWGKPGRDPRGHTISLVYLSTTANSSLIATAADDAKAVQWFPLTALPPLAFDHEEILMDVRKRTSGTTG